MIFFYDVFYKKSTDPWFFLLLILFLIFLNFQGSTGSPKAVVLSHFGTINCSYFPAKRSGLIDFKVKGSNKVHYSINQLIQL